MFYEALSKKLKNVIASTKGITAARAPSGQPRERPRTEEAAQMNATT